MFCDEIEGLDRCTDAAPNTLHDRHKSGHQVEFQQAWLISLECQIRQEPVRINTWSVVHSETHNTTNGIDFTKFRMIPSEREASESAILDSNLPTAQS